MMNYYDELKNDIKEVLENDCAEVLENATNKEDAYKKLEKMFFINDAVTGNASGSYYFNAYDSRKHCYEYSRDVKEALKMLGYSELLKKFELFERCVKYGYVNIETMEIDLDIFDEYERMDILEAWEEINDLDFETIDVITRRFLLNEVLTDVLNEIF